MTDQSEPKVKHCVVCDKELSDPGVRCTSCRKKAIKRSNPGYVFFQPYSKVDMTSFYNRKFKKVKK